MPWSVKCVDPLKTIDHTFVLANVMFGQAGKYSFDLYCDDDLIGQKAFYVRG